MNKEDLNDTLFIINKKEDIKRVKLKSNVTLSNGNSFIVDNVSDEFITPTDSFDKLTFLSLKGAVVRNKNFDNLSAFDLLVDIVVQKAKNGKITIGFLSECSLTFYSLYDYKTFKFIKGYDSLEYIESTIEYIKSL